MKPSMQPTTTEEWMAQTQSRLFALERHRHAGFVVPPAPSAGGGLESVREIDGVDNEELDITTGIGTPYTRMVFRNYEFSDPFLGTPLPSLELVTEEDAFAFETTTTGMYQAFLEIGYTFSGGTPPTTVNWRFDCFSQYFEWTSTPSVGFGVVHGGDGAQETFATPPFYEEAFNTLDGTHYMSVSAEWPGIGQTMGSPFGGGTPKCFIYLFKWGAGGGGGGVDFVPGYNMEFVGDRLDFHVYVQPTEPPHRIGTLWYQT